MVGRNGYKAVKRFWVWMRRMRYSRGFGVQSPWAYSFIRYVINEHYPYYAYGDMEVRYPNVPKDILKRGRLYFRISNYLQACGWHFADEPSPFFADYICAGCKGSKIYTLNDVNVSNDGFESHVLVTSANADLDSIHGCLGEDCDNGLLLIMEDIHKDKNALDCWHAVQGDDRTGITFDLYTCGIVFFDHKRYKQHYKVNF